MKRIALLLALYLAQGLPCGLLAERLGYWGLFLLGTDLSLAFVGVPLAMRGVARLEPSR